MAVTYAAAAPGSVPANRRNFRGTVIRVDPEVNLLRIELDVSGTPISWPLDDDRVMVLSLLDVLAESAAP